jgi:ribosomal protein L16 Arg81 hydroxylase
MLDEWLSPMSVTSFVRDYLRKSPFARPASAQSLTSAFQWSTVDRLLSQNPRPDVLPVARGKLVETPAPQTLNAARVLLSEGIGLVIRHAEQHDERLAALAESLSQHIRGKTHVQLFVTPSSTHGFGWHYDDEEVFIVQTAGVKDYFFRDNTVEPQQRDNAKPDFGRIQKETSVIGTTQLISGDWLYIPSRWWHVAKCIEDSLSISFGISVDETWLATISSAGEFGKPSLSKA